MSWLRMLILTVLLVPAASCARTVYTNLHPQLHASASAPANANRSSPQYWRNFFIYGWVPGELVIDASAYCGGAEHVERIETQRSFVQGLIAAVAGYYINIYSPYTGRVVCDYHASRR